jgi:hypothetical protein
MPPPLQERSSLNARLGNVTFLIGDPIPEVRTSEKPTELFFLFYNLPMSQIPDIFKSVTSSNPSQFNNSEQLFDINNAWWRCSFPWPFMQGPGFSAV